MTYLDSHKAPGKGRSYDRDYATDPLLRYLWKEEQAVLDGILADYYASTRSIFSISPAARGGSQVR